MRAGDQGQHRRGMRRRHRRALDRAVALVVVEPGLGRDAVVARPGPGSAVEPSKITHGISSAKLEVMLKSSQVCEPVRRRLAAAGIVVRGVRVGARERPALGAAAVDGRQVELPGAAGGGDVDPRAVVAVVGQLVPHAHAERLVGIARRLAPGMRADGAVVAVRRRARGGRCVDDVAVDGDVDDTVDAARHLVEAEEVVTAGREAEDPVAEDLAAGADPRVLVAGGGGDRRAERRDVFDDRPVQLVDRVLERIRPVEVAAERDADDVDAVLGRPDEGRT